jgi:hypothetical protein
MIRGQEGSLLLSCIGQSPTITRQFVLAHRFLESRVTALSIKISNGKFDTQYQKNSDCGRIIFQFMMA